MSAIVKLESPHFFLLKKLFLPQGKVSLRKKLIQSMLQ